MIVAFLMVVSMATNLHKEPPTVVAPFDSVEACVAEAAKRTLPSETDEGAASQGHVFFCAKVLFPV